MYDPLTKKCETMILEKRDRGVEKRRGRCVRKAEGKRKRNEKI